MSTISKSTLQDWQEQQEQDSDFVTESLELEIGYQVARLGISQWLTQAELAKRSAHASPQLRFWKVGIICQAYLS